MTSKSLSVIKLSQVSSKNSLACEPSPNAVATQEPDVESAFVSEQQADIAVPRADGGKDAWLFLAGCFVFEALIWGFPFSFGVFQSFYTTHPPFSEHPNGIAVIGTCSTGIMYFFAPISMFVLGTWPSMRRVSSVVGLITVVFAVAASSFSTEVWHLVITQGALYAVGGSLLYTPTTVYLDQRFIKKKGLAFGIMWAGTGTSGLIFPFLLTYLLGNYGFRTTLRIWALTLLILCAPLIHFVKPRIPPPALIHSRAPITYKFLTSRTFILLQLANTLESLGFFLPSIYLPTYARTLSLPPIAPTNLLATLNAFSVLGAILLGHATDKMRVSTVITISSVGTTLSVLLLWGLASSLPTLVCFAATYGVFAGGFSAIWIGMGKDVEKEIGGELGLTLMGMFSAGRGLGAVLSGPVSELLLKREPWRNAARGYGSGYGALIIFTGVTALCGLVCFGSGRRG